MPLIGFWGFDTATTEPGASRARGATGRFGSGGCATVPSIQCSLGTPTTKVVFGAAHKISALGTTTAILTLREGSVVPEDVEIRRADLEDVFIHVMNEQGQTSQGASA